MSVFGKGMVGGMVRRTMEVAGIALMVIKRGVAGGIGVFVRDLVNVLWSFMNMI